MKIHQKITSWNKKGKLLEGKADETIDFNNIVVYETGAAKLHTEESTEEVMESCNFEISFRSDKLNVINQKRSGGQATTKECSQVTKTKLHKKFGEAKKSKKVSLGNTNLIAVDEKEKKADAKRRNSTSNPVSTSNMNQSVKKRSNLSQLTKTRRNASQLVKKGSNLSHLTKNKIHTPHNRSNISHLIATDKLDKRFTSHERVSGTEKLVQYTISLDSIGGISCSNPSGHRKFREHDNPSVIISYFKKSSKNGKTLKFDISSLPLAKSYSVGKTKEMCHAKFEEEDDMGQKQKFNVSVGMTHNGRKKSGYNTKDFYLEVSLKLGHEVIKLGNAILPLRGNETGVKRSIPLGNIKLVTQHQSNKKSKTSVSKVSKIITEGLEAVSFSSDPKRKYALEGSFLLISNVRAHLKADTDKLTSMVIYPSIAETVSNLSDGDFHHSNKKHDKYTPKNDGGPPAEITKNPRTSDFSAAMAELLNLETNSTNDRSDQNNNNEESSTVVPDMSSIIGTTQDSDELIEKAFKIITASSEESVASSTVDNVGPTQRAFDIINSAPSDETCTSADGSLYSSSEGSTNTSFIASQYSTSYIGSNYSADHTVFTDHISARKSIAQIADKRDYYDRYHNTYYGSSMGSTSCGESCETDDLI